MLEVQCLGIMQPACISREEAIMQPKINTKYWGKIGHKEVKLVSISTGLGKGEVSLTNYGAE